MLNRVEADIDGPPGKAGFAVAEVIIPEPPEAVVETKERNRLPSRMETLPPCVQTPAQMLAEIPARLPVMRMLANQLYSAWIKGLKA